MKRIMSLGVILVLATVVSGQKYQGVQLLGVQALRSDFGYMGGLSYQKYLTNKTSLRLGGFYEQSKLLGMDHSSYYGNFELFRDILKPISRHTINIGIGFSVNLDQLDKTNQLGEQFKRNSTNVGALTSIDYQFYASRHLMFDVTGSANYNFVTDFARTKFWCGVGIHYIFY